jgi:hypothetical protein
MGAPALPNDDGIARLLEDTSEPPALLPPVVELAIEVGYVDAAFVHLSLVVISHPFLLARGDPDCSGFELSGSATAKLEEADSSTRT